MYDDVTSRMPRTVERRNLERDRRPEMYEWKHAVKSCWMIRPALGMAWLPPKDLTLSHKSLLAPVKSRTQRSFRAVAETLAATSVPHEAILLQGRVENE
jgi:hypothetical protein